MSDENIHIEKGVPLPAKRRKPSHRYPFAQMEIGDSFTTSASSVRGAMHAYASRRKELGIHFTVEKQPDGRFRVWRER